MEQILDPSVDPNGSLHDSTYVLVDEGIEERPAVKLDSTQTVERQVSGVLVLTY